MDGFLSFYYYYTIKLVMVFTLISFLFSSSYDDSFFPVSTFSFSSFDWLLPVSSCFFALLFVQV